MTEKGIVISIKKNKIFVTPLISEACSSCSGGCNKKTIIIPAINPEGLALKEGTMINFEVSAKSKAVQGFLSLLLPFACAIAGFFLAKPVMSLFGVNARDGIQAIFVLSFLTVSSLLVYIISRKKPLPGKVTITSLL